VEDNRGTKDRLFRWQPPCNEKKSFQESTGKPQRRGRETRFRADRLLIEGPPRTEDGVQKLKKKKKGKKEEEKGIILGGGRDLGGDDSGDGAAQRKPVASNVTKGGKNQVRKK